MKARMEGSSEGACEEIKGEAAGEIVRRSIDVGLGDCDWSEAW
jgi:hypothetical protein